MANTYSRGSGNSSKAPQNKEAKKKKSLKEACTDLWTVRLEQERQREIECKAIQTEKDQRKLWIEMYGPPIDPTSVWKPYRGHTFSSERFDRILFELWQKFQNRLPWEWTGAQHLMNDGVSKGVIEELPDGKIRISVSETGSSGRRAA